VIEDAAQRRANFLIVHHGLFWHGAQPLTGWQFERIRLLIESDIAVYSSHLPLDAHPVVGNNVLLAREFGLSPARPFARVANSPVGVAGDADIETAVLVDAVDRFARAHGGRARTSAVDAGRRTRHWAICSGAGATADTLKEAHDAGVDTLIVGEGPHHTAVEAPEYGLVIIYAGHYATETPGVKALAAYAAEAFGLPWEFLPAPTGL
jgi:dinuclear metal center YbgI/SA1388 family protein